MIEINDAEFNLMKAYLHNACGIDIPLEKKYLFNTRLGGLLYEQGCRNFSELHIRLTVSKDEALKLQLVQAMTTHESSFLRDLHPFEVLSKKLLPKIALHRIDEAIHLPPQIRILSTGCSAGQEPYSIAICVQEWLNTQQEFKQENVSIKATDISGKVLAKAREGRYTNAEIGNHLSSRQQRLYFKQRENCWELSEEIRRMVSFIETNLSEPFEHMGKFDLIFCRNVMIYFSNQLKQKILKQFRHMLLPGGALIMGASESLYNLSDDFCVVHEGATTYYVPANKEQATT